MESNVASGVQKRKSLRAEPGNNCLSSSHTLREVTLEAERAGLGCLSRLTLALTQDSYPSKAAENLAQGLPLEDLEMLEAELVNQGILNVSPQCAFSLVRQGMHEINLWRWRAKRIGFDPNRLEFEMSVPHYIIYHSEQLLADLQLAENGASRIGGQSWRYRGSRKTMLMEELRYLDRYAAYLCGEFESTQDRYQQGLNLVLKAICLGARQRRESPAGDALMICLPIGKTDFYQSIREAADKAV